MQKYTLFLILTNYSTFSIDKRLIFNIEYFNILFIIYKFFTFFDMVYLIYSTNTMVVSIG